MHLLLRLLVAVQQVELTILSYSLNNSDNLVCMTFELKEVQSLIDEGFKVHLQLGEVVLRSAHEGELPYCLDEVVGAAPRLSYESDPEQGRLLAGSDGFQVSLTHSSVRGVIQEHLDELRRVLPLLGCGHLDLWP